MAFEHRSNVKLEIQFDMRKRSNIRPEIMIIIIGFAVLIMIAAAYGIGNAIYDVIYHEICEIP